MFAPLRSLLALALLGSVPVLSASLLRMETVTQPLYLHGSDMETRIVFQAVPFITHHSEPEWRFPAISAPCIPSTAPSRPPQDVNLASLYRISAAGTYKPESHDLKVTIDASKAVRPEEYPFTIDQVVDAVVTCVRLMYPERPPGEGALEVEILRALETPASPTPAVSPAP